MPADTTKHGSSKRLLVIAHSFPPDAQVGARRIGRLCRYLPEFGVEPVVLTVDGDQHRQLDDSFPLPPGLRVERATARVTLLDRYGRWRAGADAGAAPASTSPPRTPSRMLDSLRRHLLALLQIPDGNRGWIAPAVTRGSRLLQPGGFDAIFSSGPPWSTHVVAYKLKRMFHLPWLADFRDPWAPAANVGAPAWRRRLNARMEADCIRDADLVTCNTEPQRQNFLSRFPHESGAKFVTLTNGFDGPAPASPPHVPGAPHLLLHLGSIYDDRPIDLFCTAVERLLSDGQLNPATFKALFVGSHEQAPVRAAAACAPRAVAAGMIEIRAPVPFAATRKLLNEADSLLIIQGDLRLQVPAKFYECLQTGKPILAVVAPGALSQLLDETGAGLWAKPDDVDGMAQALTQVLTLPSRSPADVESRWAPRFHFRALADRLSQLIESAIAAGGTTRRLG